MTQKVSVQFFDAADAKEVNKRILNILPRGIYEGGYLTKVTDSQVSVSPLIVEIGDNDNQVRISNDASQLVSVTNTTTYVVLRWAYVASPSNVMTYVGTSYAGILDNDIIVGNVVYSGGGGVITGFDYSPRETPNTHDMFLKAIPTVPASMSIRIMPGKINYGVQNYDVIDQTVLLVAPISGNPRVDLVYADSDGLIKVSLGTPAASPVAPLYNGKMGLAEVTLTVGMTTITKAAIKDVRAFLSGGGYAVYAP